MTASDSPVRRRDATGTRQAILRSAMIAFTRSGYDGAGVREIAQGAGVTAMLVNRYFGSKEHLFAEVVDTVFAQRALLTDDVSTLAHDVAAGLTRQPLPGTDAVDGFLLLLRSVSNPQATEILRDGIERHYQQHLITLMPGTDPRQRAALFLSVIAGFRLMREIIGITELADASAPRLQMIFELLTDPPPIQAHR